jgi:hypothetical protein
MATKVALTEPARTRIVRITNVHFDADIKVLEEFFESFVIEDHFRTVNTSTGTKSVVYVLFGTAVERIKANSMSGRYVLNRRVKIQPAPDGNYKCKFFYLGRYDHGTS